MLLYQPRFLDIGLGAITAKDCNVENGRFGQVEWAPRELSGACPSSGLGDVESGGAPRDYRAVLLDLPVVV